MKGLNSKLVLPSLSNYSLQVIKTRAYHLKGGCYSSRTGVTIKEAAEYLCDPNITIEQDDHSFVNTFIDNAWYKLDNEAQIQFTGYFNGPNSHSNLPTNNDHVIQSC